MWKGLDYSSWEQANFADMKWKYDDCTRTACYRDIKRISKYEWLITDDHGEWVDYADSVGANTEAGVLVTQIIEDEYQLYLKEVS